MCIACVRVCGRENIGIVYPFSQPCVSEIISAYTILTLYLLHLRRRLNL